MKRIVLGGLLSCMLMGQVANINATPRDELLVGAMIGVGLGFSGYIQNAKGAKPEAKVFAAAVAFGGATLYALRSESSVIGVLGGFLFYGLSLPTGSR